MSLAHERRTAAVRAPLAPVDTGVVDQEGAETRSGRIPACRARFGTVFWADRRPINTPRPCSVVVPRGFSAPAGSGHGSGHIMEDLGHRKATRSLQIQPSHRLSHDDSDLEMPQAQSLKTCTGKPLELPAEVGGFGLIGVGSRRGVRLGGDRAAQLEEQPVGKRSKNEAKAVGFKKVTADPVAFKDHL